MPAMPFCTSCDEEPRLGITSAWPVVHKVAPLLVICDLKYQLEVPVLAKINVTSSHGPDCLAVSAWHGPSRVVPIIIKARQIQALKTKLI